MLEQEPNHKYGIGKVFDNEAFELEARLAEKFASHFAIVAAIEDGEDSVGRAKLRLATPEEVVNRSFAIAKLFVTKAKQENLIFKMNTEVVKETIEKKE